MMNADALLSAGNSVELHWNSEARVAAENRQWAKHVRPKVCAEVQQILHGGRSVAENYLKGHRGLEVLDAHQVVNVAAMTVPMGYGLCIFDEQGTGKTVTQIFAFDMLVDRDEIDFALIVAPKSMLTEWVTEFQRLKGDLYKVTIATGKRRQKRGTLSVPTDVLITNFETAVALESELQAMLRSYQGRSILVVDESYHVKNLDAKRTLALRRLREWCKRAFVLCGSPAPNAADDLIQQFNIVDFGITFDGISLPDDANQRRAAVRNAIESRGVFVRHLKRDVLPFLPNKRFDRVRLSLQPTQAALYSKALRDYASDLQSMDQVSFRHHLRSFLAKRAALLQICSNPLGVIPGYAEVPTKLIALDELLSDLVTRKGEKVIVWSFFTASLDSIFERYKKYNPVRYDGTVSDVRLRREAVHRFQEDDSTMLFVGNPAAAGAGLTLHRARTAIYESFSNQAAHYIQSIDRIHRRGQARDVDYLVLLCERTIEEMEFDRLTKKLAAQRSLLGDSPEEPITRDMLLAEAIAALDVAGG